jgi:hypothetical protein
MKMAAVLLFSILVVGCVWPKIRIAGDEYYLSPTARGEVVTLPVPGADSGSGSSGKGVRAR